MSGESPDLNNIPPYDYEFVPLPSKALLAAEHRGYERGRKEGIEEAAKVVDKETEAPAQRNSKSMWVQDIGDRLATAIRQLLEVKG